MISGLSPGIYQVSVLAFTTDGLRAGQAAFGFIVSGRDYYGMGLRVMQGSTIIPYNGSFDFDTVPAISRDKEIVFTVINGGTVNLALTGTPLVAISGDDADAFTIDAGETLSALPAKRSTTFTVRMTGTEAGGDSLDAQISIANDISSINPFLFTVHCTDKVSNTLIFNNVTAGSYFGVAGNFTGLATITLSGGGGGAAYNPGNPPYVPGSVSSGSRGGNGGDGDEVIFTNISMQHGVNYVVTIGSGGAGGAGGTINAHGGTGGNGQASSITADGVTLVNAAGGLGGGGGRTGSSLPGTDRPANDGADGGSGGAGGSGYTTTRTTGTPPYQRTITIYHRNPGSYGTIGHNGYATIFWTGFELP